MPFISSVSGKVSPTSFARAGAFPIIEGGTLTSDSTYYYRTFTNHSFVGDITDYITIKNKPINFDYVLVAGGGGGTSGYILGYYRYAYTCLQCCACCDDFGQPYYYAATCYGSNIAAYTAIGGGAGGVLTGSTSLNPGSYSIKIGSGGLSGFGLENNKGRNSSAFNDAITAIGGGASGTSCTDTYSFGGSGGGRLVSSSCTTDNSTAGQGNRGGIAASTGVGCATQILNYNSCSGFNYCIQQGAGGGGAGGVGGGGDLYIGCDNNQSYFANNDGLSNGSGITALGLTVGAGGQRTSSSNTGNGSIYGGSSGVLRIRYLRSLVGG